MSLYRFTRTDHVVHTWSAMEAMSSKVSCCSDQAISLAKKLEIINAVESGKQLRSVIAER